MDLSFGFELPDPASPNGWQAETYIDGLQSAAGDFLFGGPKATADTPMTIECSLCYTDCELKLKLVLFIVKDVLVMANANINGTAYSWGTTGLAFLSLHNDTLRLDPSLNFEPPVLITANITNWVWVNNGSLCKGSRTSLFFASF